MQMEFIKLHVNKPKVFFIDPIDVFKTMKKVYAAAMKVTQVEIKRQWGYLLILRSKTQMPTQRLNFETSRTINY